ncbi:major capsid protein [Tortoise microvirus 78]|nr:major capsid protein [Tortoise microvirus 78]
MKTVNRQETRPQDVPRTQRNHNVTVLSSMPAGKVVPLAAVPLLREDALRGLGMNIAVEMHETVEVLMNPVHVIVQAHLVPWLAFDRFEGSEDQFNRSYMGQKKTDDAGAAVVPFIEKHAMGAHGSVEVYKRLGLHGNPTDQVNTAYLEAYNKIWNFRAKNRSPSIVERARLDGTLAQAFWPASRFQHIVPNFDQAVIDGEVALNLVNKRIPVMGIGVGGNVTTAGQIVGIKESGSQTAPTWNHWFNGSNVGIKATGLNGFPDVWAELQENGVTLSLSNLELAKKTQAFAKIREQYNELDDEWVIDMLMDGLSIPNQALKQPILLGQQSAKFGQAKRYATDSGNLDESVVSGLAALSMRLRAPRLHVGGVVMVTAEVVPEQLFERQKDPFFHLGSVDELPEFMRDTLDPEKVEVVQNGFIDTSHATPNGTFGYAPLNHKWTTFGPRIGGRFLRPTANTATDVARQRIWAVETVNPQLSQNFYVVSDIHLKPFVDQTTDPFDVVIVGNGVIEGNTVFGGVLHENATDYDAIMAKAPQQRIVKP